MNSSLTPHLTEKTYALAKDLNTYIFKAEKSLNKVQIKAMIETEYEVEVTDLRTMIAKGKQARSIRIKSRSGRRFNGRRKTLKKAYVTLKAGDVIPAFTDFTEKEGQPA